MTNFMASFTRALGQLGDPAILKVLAKSITVTLVVLAALGIGVWQAGAWAFAGWQVPYGAEIGAVLGALALVIGGWLLFRIIALAVLQFFADEVVLAVEAKHYPQARESARALPFREDVRNSLKGLTRAVLVNLLVLPLALVLLVTGIGTALVFWAANGWLLGRELHDMVWLRHRSSPEDAPPLPAGQRFLLGGAIAALMAIPFANLLAPIIGAATATHMVHRRRLADKNATA